jgi:outer membrane protein TolC
MRAFIVLTILALPAWTQPLDSLVDEALHRNREILTAQKKYEAARQRPTQASSLPDPTLSVGYTANGGPWPVAGIGSEPTSNAGFMVSQEVPFPGKQKLRGEIAQKDAEADFESYLAVRLNVISRLKQAYHELHHADANIAAVHRFQDVLRNMLAVSEARYAVGQAAQQDIFKAQTQFSIFQARLVQYEQERSTKEIEINALLNRPSAGHIDAADEMIPGDLMAPLDELLARARTRSPMLGEEQKRIERAELATNLARKEYYPDYTLLGGYFNQASLPPMWQFRVDFKVPAYFWRKQRAGVAEQAFATSEARHSFEAADVSLQARIRSEYTVAETARQLIGLYQKSVIPEAQLALESSLASYQTGGVDFLSVFSNFMNVAEYELMYHEQVMQFHVARARLEELTTRELE